MSYLLNRVYISGTWDLFHRGHLKVLRKVHKLGPYLVVGVNTDSYARSLGKNPIFPYKDRRAMIKALYLVNEVVPHKSADDLSGCRENGVNIRVVGPSWGKLEGQKRARKKMRKLGIKLVVLPRTSGISTKIIKERIKSENI